MWYWSTVAGNAAMCDTCRDTLVGGGCSRVTYAGQSRHEQCWALVDCAVWWHMVWGCKGTLAAAAKGALRSGSGLAVSSAHAAAGVTVKQPRLAGYQRLRSSRLFFSGADVTQIKQAVTKTCDMCYTVFLNDVIALQLAAFRLKASHVVNVDQYAGDRLITLYMPH